MKLGETFGMVHAVECLLIVDPKHHGGITVVQGAENVLVQVN